MNKEKLAQLLAEALEKKCYINLHFSQYQGEELTDVQKSEAYELIQRYNEALGNVEVTQRVGDSPCDWYQIDNGTFRVTINYIPSNEEKVEGKHKRIEELKKELSYLEEDVDLSGGEQHAI